MLLAEPISATPIVVLATEGGFIVGTNATRSKGAPGDSGMKACKLHYQKTDVLLMAGNVVAHYGLPIIGPPVKLYDFDDEVWRSFESGQTGADLLDAITRRMIALYDAYQDDLIAMAKRNNPDGNPHGNVIFELLLAHHDKGVNVLYARRLFADESTNHRLRIDQSVNSALPFREGAMLTWNVTDTPNAVPQLLGRTHQAEDVLKTLEPLGKLDGFQPPFLVGELNDNGFHFLSPKEDNSVCTAYHREPFEAPASPQNQTDH